MRLVITLNQAEVAERFSLFLDEKNIKNQIDAKPNNQFIIWVFDEDDVKKANEAYQEFSLHPEWTPSFQTLRKKEQERLEKEAEIAFNRVSISSNNDEEEPAQEQAIEQEEEEEEKVLQDKPKPSFGKLTLIVMALCIFLFLWASFSAPQKVNLPRQGQAYLNIFFLPPYNALTFEEPLAYQYSEQLLQNMVNADNPELYLKSAEALDEIRKIKMSPYWHGLYDTYIIPVKSTDTTLAPSPQFIQIKQGEVWRLFTPALLHGNFFHILFNLLWFAFLGHQMEKRIGFWRLLCFLLVAAFCTNVAQYLMSGPNFLGLSGVVMAMAGFIWMRQAKAAWEGYNVQKATLYFLAFYVLALLALQIVSFVMEYSGHAGIAPNIANTAHILGAIIGLLMGRMNFFAAWDLGKINK